MYMSRLAAKKEWEFMKVRQVHLSIQNTPILMHCE
jgi:hypothetical protein